MIINFQPGEKPDSPVLIALHGWTGDENTMTIFTNNIGSRFSRLLPRAPYPSSEGGFSWVPPETSRPSRFSDLKPAADLIASQWTEWLSQKGVSAPPKFSLVGFSQGAALSLIITILYPNLIDRAAILAGFLPEGYSETDLQKVRGIRYFVSHGTRDEIIEYEKAEKFVSVLRSNGAEVEFCPAEVGHRISAGCFKNLEAFFNGS